VLVLVPMIVIVIVIVVGMVARHRMIPGCGSNRLASLLSRAGAAVRSMDENMFIR
jgi:hypothetical protein